MPRTFGLIDGNSFYWRRKPPFDPTRSRLAAVNAG